MIASIVGYIAVLIAGACIVASDWNTFIAALLLASFSYGARQWHLSNMLRKILLGIVKVSRINTEEDVIGYLAEVADRLKSAEWDRDLVERVARNLSDHPLLEELMQPAALRRFSTPELFQRILTVVAGFTKAKAAGVVFKSENGISVVSYGVSGKRFESYLFEIASKYWAGDTSVLGVRDAFEPNAVWGGAGSFGHRYSNVSAFFTGNESESLPKATSLVWLGYAHGSRPSLAECDAAAELLTTLSNAIVAAHRIAILDSRAQCAEVHSSQTSQMLAHVSHDIRTPLMNVKAILHLLAQADVEDREDVEELTRVALQNCTELGELVGDVIDFTRERSGQLVVKKKALNLTEVCANIVSSFSIAARQRGLDLSWSSDGEYWIIGDPGHVRRAVSNLVSNALKYTPCGSITVSLKKELQAGRNLILSISDTGLGMNPDQLQRLFTPFSRFHRDSADGIGLGLAITKIFIEECGGSISVNSAVGEGTCFTVQIPAYMNELKVSTEIQHSTQNPIEVLLVDDDVDVGASLARLIRNNGYTVKCVSSVAVARQELFSRRYDVVISDLTMPGGGGRVILDCALQLENVPAFFILTGDYDSSLVTNLKALGAIEVFEKPVDYVCLINSIEAYFSGLKMPLAATYS